MADRAGLITIARMSYIHGCLYYIVDHEKATVKELFENQKETIKSGLAGHNKRIDDLCGMAECLGLIERRDGDLFVPTPAGIEYAGMRDAYKWTMTAGQSALLRGHIEKNPRANIVVQAINVLLGLLAEGYSGPLQDAFCNALGKEKDWRPVSREGYLGFYLNHIRELRYGLNGYPTPKCLFLQPAGDETAQRNFKRTMLSSIDAVAVRNALRHHGLDRSGDATGMFPIHMWGVTNTEQHMRIWDSMIPGDKILFYQNGSYVAMGTLIEKAENAELAEAWESGADSKPFDLVYLLKDVVFFKAAASVVHDALGYSSNYRLQGFTKPNQEHVDELTKKYGSLDAFLSSITGRVVLDYPVEAYYAEAERRCEENIKEEISGLPDEEKRSRIDARIAERDSAAQVDAPRPVKTESQTYEDDPLLKACLKEKYKGVCQVCGSTFRMRNGACYAEVHHLLPRSMGGQNKSSNMVVVCATCHRKFHFAEISEVNEMAGKLNEAQRANLAKFLTLG